MSDVKQIYLAGAIGYGGALAEYSEKWRKEAMDYLQRKQVNCKCTSLISFCKTESHPYQTERELMRFALRMVREADMVLVNLKDLNKSIGTCDEIFYAWTKGIPVIGFLENGKKEEIHGWKVEQIDRMEVGKGALTQALEYIVNYYDCPIMSGSEM